MGTVFNACSNPQAVPNAIEQLSSSIFMDVIGLTAFWLAAQALVHARSTSTDVPRGILLAELLMDKQDTDPQFKVRSCIREALLKTHEA
jgi:hypothetical protein